MEAEARYTFVGAAVLVLVAALLGAVVWLKDVGGRNQFDHYAIHFERQALDGLEVGGEVNLRGIKIGRVEDYALAGEQLNRVRVEVRVDRRTPVRTNTVAVVTRNFVTGIAAITLVNGEPPGEPLKQVPAGETHPVIGEGRSDLDELAGRVNQVGELANSALSSVNQLLRPENRRVLVDAVAELRDLAAGLNGRLGALDRTLERTGVAAASVGGAADRLGRAAERAAATAERTGAQLDSTLAEGERALRDARAALEQVTRSIETVEQQAGSTARRLESTAAQVDDQLGAALSELRLSTEVAARALDRLGDPRAAILGPSRAQLGPGEERR